ncbi:MAG: hypothetical protein PUF35_03570, partial [Subdoligranulum sp.]|nr:hypothetical protein [Subdoligranulum sp.]
WYEGPIIHKLYLSAILDLCDRRIVSYVIRDRNDNKLVFDTLDKAVLERQAGLFYFYFYSLLLAFSPGTATVLQQASPCHRKNTDLIFSHYYKSSKSSETAFASREWQSRIFTKNSPLQTMECRILCRYTNSIRQFA